jgi:hypothetical protein
MKRPNTLLKWLLGMCLLLAAAEFAALAWLAPYYVMRTIEHAARGTLTIEGAGLSLPLTTTLRGLRLAANTPETSLTIQQAVIRPQWVWPASKTVWLDAVELRQPFIRVTRTKAGALVWPSLPGAHRAPAPGLGAGPTPWRVHIASLSIVDGTIEYVDRKPSTAFHGVIEHVSLDLGPVIVPLDGSWASPAWSRAAATAMSFATRGRFVGERGHSAPVFCSGWWSPQARDLQASCRLDEVALAAFEPYFRGPPELRVYATTLTSTSQWTAKANDFNGRIQLQLDNLTEGDLSIRGRTILDVKRLANGGQTPSLTGEISLVGPLDTPSLWHAALLPGNDAVQQLVKRLLDRGVEVIRVPLLSGHMRLSLIPSSEATMTTIDRSSRQVQDALEILTFPPKDLAPAPVPLTPAEAAAAAAAHAAPSSETIPSASSPPPAQPLTPNGAPLPPPPLKPVTSNQ